MPMGRKRLVVEYAQFRQRDSDVLEWVGMGWNELQWIGIGWSGLKWVGMGWSGLEWVGWVGMGFWLTEQLWRFQVSVN